jgi:hypothetical protein
MFRVPYYYPSFEPGQQIVNFGQGGPASHPHEQITAPRIFPLVYDVHTMGLGNMPRQVLGQIPVIISNQWYTSPSALMIDGLQKKP